MIELTGAPIVDRTSVGNKAYNLNELIGRGFRVPPTAVIPAGVQVVDGASLFAWLEGTVGAGPWALAVRSSSSHEDTTRDSKAGHFLSLLDTFDRTSIVDAVRRVQESGPGMAVAIQPLLTPQIAGVLFSCDPLTFSRERCTLVWTSGLADRLVAGDDPGHRLSVFKDGTIEAGEWPSDAGTLDELVKAAFAIETERGAPVDIEWVIDDHRKLWLVQARPVVLPQPCCIPLNSDAGFSRLPMLVHEHPKVRLRRQARVSGVPMAPAIIQVSPVRPHQQDDIDRVFAKSVGVSVVLLHPERVEQQVVREFAPVRGSDVDFFARTCRRYSVRRYPRAGSIASTMTSTCEAGLTTSWVSVVLVQALWDAYATGIIQRTDDGYIIEVALGHFVPKGVVPTSTVVLSREKAVISESWREQPTAYHFIDGHVVTETPPREQLHLESRTLAKIAETFDPLFEAYGNPVLEFGMLEWSDGESVFLIDVAEGTSSAPAVDLQSISSGVLSPGACRGRVLRVDLAQVGALDSHLHDRISEAEIDGEDIVVVAERASVDLLPFVGVRGVVGFVFNRGSVLAHLAVVLRERGIPAVVLDDQVVLESLPTDAVIEIDATPRSVLQRDRVRLV